MDKLEQQKKIYLERFAKEIRMLDDDLLEEMKFILWVELTDRRVGDSDGDI